MKVEKKSRRVVITLDLNEAEDLHDALVDAWAAEINQTPSLAAYKDRVGVMEDVIAKALYPLVLRRPDPKGGIRRHA